MLMVSFGFYVLPLCRLSKSSRELNESFNSWRFLKISNNSGSYALIATLQNIVCATWDVDNDLKFKMNCDHVLVRKITEMTDFIIYTFSLSVETTSVFSFWFLSRIFVSLPKTLKFAYISGRAMLLPKILHLLLQKLKRSLRFYFSYISNMN